MSTIILSPYALTFHIDELQSLNFSILKYVISFTLLCTVLAYFLYFKILQITGAGNLLICTIIIPPSAILLNAIILGENINFTELFGLTIILFGLIILDGCLIKKF
tara:strand:- start:613 stop:930 length:318 start_codon:yes stop_codon:yes gene_type:complete